MLILYGLYGGLIQAPTDYQQGESFRILYLHVPAAWMSLLAYVIMAAAAFGMIKDHCLDRIVTRPAGECLAHRVTHVERKRMQRLGAIERDQRDRVTLFDSDGFVSQNSLSIVAPA